MDRRAFLRRLGFGTVAAAAAVVTFDVEKLLWLPGEKAIVLPAVEVFEAPLVLSTMHAKAAHLEAIRLATRGIPYQDAMTLIRKAFTIIPDPAPPVQQVFTVVPGHWIERDV